MGVPAVPPPRHNQRQEKTKIDLHSGLSSYLLGCLANLLDFSPKLELQYSIYQPKRD